MMKVRNDLTGQKFGRLTVLYQADDYVFPSGQRQPRWHCVCDCDQATEIDVLGSNLISRKTQSCGCYNKEMLSQRTKKYNKYEIVGDVVNIYLNDKNEFTYINLDKWGNIPYIQELCWCKNDNGYAVANVPKSLREYFGKTKVYLHQLICPCAEGFEPDHKDRNRLNNLTSNLVLKTRQHNNLNKGISKKNTSGVVGVYLNKRNKTWMAQININKKTVGLGSFTNKEEAIKTRLKAELQYYGGFAPQAHLFQEYNIK